MKEEVLERQRAFFQSGKTRSVAFRMEALKNLRQALRDREGEIAEALKQDLGKSAMESYMCEVGLTVSEISFQLKHIKRFTRSRWAPTPLANFHAVSKIQLVPRGNVLIMSPWNYPFLLSIEPLVDALAAGNTAVLKPSAYSPATSEVIRKLLGDLFPEEYVTVATGGRAENEALLSMPFDYIFFTGSQAVGREVLRQAAEHLTPVALELGGKSPCIVDDTALLPLAAKRIVWGKYLNCGQTCVAPDYILCDEKIRDRLLVELKREIVRQFGERPLENPDYGKIINEKHFQRISRLINPEKLVFGGKLSESTLQIEPALLSPVTWDDPVMQEEIFGPVLPVLTYRTLSEAIETVEAHPHPLALYIFSQSKANRKLVTESCRYGGGCVNDVVVHLATSTMPFGGVGASGMGAYHGKYGFEAFSHRKSTLDKKTWIDLPIRYQPYRKINESLLRLFLR